MKIIVFVLLFYCSAVNALSINFPNDITVWIDESGHLIDPVVAMGEVSEEGVFLPENGICYTRGYASGAGVVDIDGNFKLHVTAKDWNDIGLKYVPRQTYPFRGYPEGVGALGFDIKVVLKGETTTFLEAGSYKLGFRSTDVQVHGDRSFVDVGVVDGCWKLTGITGGAGSVSESVVINGENTTIHVKYID